MMFGLRAAGGDWEASQGTVYPPDVLPTPPPLSPQGITVPSFITQYTAAEIQQGQIEAAQAAQKAGYCNWYESATSIGCQFPSMSVILMAAGAVIVFAFLGRRR